MQLFPSLTLLLVACTLFTCSLPLNAQKKKETLFGAQYKRYTVTSSRLKGAVFYLVSGHGGPDPGCIGRYQGKEVHEDEYAYDITLRLGRRLMEHGAKVYFIIQDAKDGIRDQHVLGNSKRETCMGKPIPLDQIARLRQRSEAVNRLYRKDRASYKRAIFIHVDSRSKGNQIDLFAYHAPKSTKGKQLTQQIIRTFDAKYRQHQPNRNYDGDYSERNLYVLRNTLPVAAFIEVGNIQNQLDQKRLVIPNNRQALANWITEAILKDYAQNKPKAKPAKKKKSKKKRK